MKISSAIFAITVAAAFVSWWDFIGRLDDVRIEFDNKQPSLNIYSVKPISCIKALDALKLQPFNIHGKYHRPFCFHIKYNFIKISYVVTDEV